MLGFLDNHFKVTHGLDLILQHFTHFKYGELVSILLGQVDQCLKVGDEADLELQSELPELVGLGPS